jgi:hypothetical protein
MVRKINVTLVITPEITRPQSRNPTRHQSGALQIAGLPEVGGDALVEGQKTLPESPAHHKMTVRQKISAQKNTTPMGPKLDESVEIRLKSPDVNGTIVPEITRRQFGNRSRCQCGAQQLATAWVDW